mgnify:CR=1 FL=1|jgi:hypothetical protein
MSQIKIDDSLILNSREIVTFLEHVIRTNRGLQDRGMMPTAVNIEGHAGLGKTSTVLQVAQRNDLHMVKINLAQCEELGDIVGFPVKEYKLEDGTWITSDHLNVVSTDRLDANNLTGEVRMGYAVPAWIQGRTDKGGILLLDDYTRADPRYMQAVMELIDRQEYISFKLPKGWTIILTSNPANDNYMVQEIDNAMKTRFITIQYGFDAETWATWAEQNALDQRCINFVLKHPEIMSPEKINPRSIVHFFNQISDFKDFKKQLKFIRLVGDASCGPETTSLFINFINDELDKLPDIRAAYDHKDVDFLGNQIRSATNTDGTYKAAIASILATRLVIFLNQLHSKKPVDKGTKDRLTHIVKEKIFMEDLTRHICQSLIANNDKFASLAMQQEFSSYVLGA